uniref:SSD domain-containing protein n=1 Tax=Chromera velia CCMP2878 TaxID=1169474 RepID=A0A0G4I6I6_9ALVE|eukprot:Cvel_11425.t1-p1 / transcript=Cvel_11425.t1 / gene=Cvel_11425 / organism=Chromera_velia_CCMP2878 / gene_product=hypothetical protein / transcript_product=hypothetical protein / location=Cvel_scaffold718:24808-32379(-) / protein_length=1920 / sequence_SO=supercontig / SO=protein_coding / is_pseudo=false
MKPARPVNSKTSPSWYPRAWLKSAWASVASIAFRWPLLSLLVPVLGIVIAWVVMVTAYKTHLDSSSETVADFMAHWTNPDSTAVRDLEQYRMLFGENRRPNVALVRSLDEEKWNLLSNDTGSMQIERMRSFHKEIMEINVTIPVDPHSDLLPGWRDQSFNKSKAALPEWSAAEGRAVATFNFKDLCAAANDGSCFYQAFNSFWHDRDFGGRFGSGCSGKAVKFQYHDQFPEGDFGPKAWTNIEILVRDPVLWDRPKDNCVPAGKNLQGSDGLTFMYVLDDAQMKKVHTHVWSEMEANVTDGRAPLGLIWRRHVLMKACDAWELAFIRAADKLKQEAEAESGSMEIDYVSFMSIQKETDLRRDPALMWSLRISIGVVVALLLVALHISWSAVFRRKWRVGHLTSKVRSVGISALAVVLAWAATGPLLVGVGSVVTVEGLPVVIIPVGLSLVFDFFSTYFVSQHIGEPPCCSAVSGGASRGQEGEPETDRRGFLSTLCCLPDFTGRSGASLVAEARTRRAAADTGVTVTVTILSVAALFLLGLGSPSAPLSVLRGSPYEALRIFCCYVLTSLALLTLLLLTFVPACLGLEARFEAAKSLSDQGRGDSAASPSVEPPQLEKEKRVDPDPQPQRPPLQSPVVKAVKADGEGEAPQHPLEKMHTQQHLPSRPDIRDSTASPSRRVDNASDEERCVPSLTMSDVSTGEAAGLALQADMLRHPARWSRFSSSGCCPPRPVPNPLAELLDEEEGEGEVHRPKLTHAATSVGSLRATTFEEAVRPDSQGPMPMLADEHRDLESCSREVGEGLEGDIMGDKPSACASAEAAVIPAAAASRSSMQAAHQAGGSIHHIADVPSPQASSPAVGPITSRLDSTVSSQASYTNGKHSLSSKRDPLPPPLRRVCTDAGGTPQQGLRVVWLRNLMARGLFHPLGLSFASLAYAAVLTFALIGLLCRSRFWLRSIADIADTGSHLRNFFTHKDQYFTETDDVLTVFAEEGLAWEDPAIQQLHNETFQRLNSSKDISLVESGFYRFMLFQQAQAPILERMRKEEEERQRREAEGDSNTTPDPFDNFGSDFGSSPSPSTDSSSTPANDYWSSLLFGDFFGESGGSSGSGGGGDSGSVSSGSGGGVGFDDFDWDWNEPDVSTTPGPEPSTPTTAESSTTTTTLSDTTTTTTPAPSTTTPSSEASTTTPSTVIASEPPVAERRQLASPPAPRLRTRRRSLKSSSSAHRVPSVAQETSENDVRVLCDSQCWTEWEAEKSKEETETEESMWGGVVGGVTPKPYDHIHPPTPAALSVSMTPEREHFEQSLREWLRGDNITFWASELLAQTDVVYAGPLFINDFLWEDQENMRGLRTFRSIIVTRAPGTGRVDFRRYFDGNNVTGQLEGCIYDPGSMRYGMPAENPYSSGCINLNEVVVSASAYLRPAAVGEGRRLSSSGGSVFDRGEEADAMIRNTTAASTTRNWGDRQCLSWGPTDPGSSNGPCKGGPSRPVNNSMVIESRGAHGGEGGALQSTNETAAQAGVLVLDFSTENQTIPVRVYSLTLICGETTTVHVRGLNAKDKEWVKKVDCGEGEQGTTTVTLSEDRSDVWFADPEFTKLVSLEIASNDPFALAEVELWPEPAPAVRGGDLGTRHEQLSDLQPALGSMRLTSTFWAFYQSLPVMLESLWFQLFIALAVYFVIVSLFLDPFLAFFASLGACSVVVSVLGLMALWDTRVNETSVLWVMVCPALACAAVTKVVSAYADAGGETRQQRSVVSLVLSGPQILFLVAAILVIAFFLSPLYTDRVLPNLGSKILFLTALSSGFHSLVVLPCLLFLVGPFSHRRRARRRAEVKARLRDCAALAAPCKSAKGEEGEGRVDPRHGTAGQVVDGGNGGNGNMSMRSASVLNTSAAMSENQFAQQEGSVPDPVKVSERPVSPEHEHE